MRYRFSDFGLRTQIGSIVAAAILSLIAVAGIHLAGKIERDRLLAQAEQANLAASGTRELEIGLLQMRRAEKNFLMRLDLAYAKEHEASRESTNRALSDLKGRFAGGSSENVAALGRIAEGVGVYDATFDKLVALRQRLGLTPDAGLEGDLRRAERAIETVVVALDDTQPHILLLKMLGAEKDVLLRKASSDVETLRKYLTDLRVALARPGMSATVRGDVQRALATYGGAFDAWLQGNDDVAAVEKSMMNVHRGIEPEMAGLRDRVLAAADAAEAEAEATSRRADQRIVWAFGAIVLLLVAAAGYITRSITRDLGRMSGIMTRIADGRLDEVVVGGDRPNEIGAMARAVEVFRENAVERRRLEDERAGERARAEAERRRVLAELADDFERRIGGVVTTVSSAASELEGAARTLTASSQEASARSMAVAGASEQATANVQSVATATEELAGTVAEVGRQVQHSAEIAAKASDEAKTTRAQVSDLATAAQQIGSILQLIHDIAAKTNLLALNATIEAARAGEAGRGFAIVAQEVKGLAEQTARATAEIAAQVQSIQSSTHLAADAIATIDRTIEEMNGISGSVAAAVEEQGVTTREIVRNLAQAAQGATDVSANIAGVSMAVDGSNSASAEVLTSAGELARQAEALRAAVGRFLTDIRVA